MSPAENVFRDCVDCGAELSYRSFMVPTEACCARCISERFNASEAERVTPSLPPRVRRRGSFFCRHCGAGEAMPGHEC